MPVLTVNARKCRIASIIAIAMAPPKTATQNTSKESAIPLADPARGYNERNRTAAKLLSCLKSGSMLPADRGYDADWIRVLARQARGQ